MRLLLNWVLSALAVWIVAKIVPGISVSGPVAALIAALVIGFINATLGALLKILTFPLTLLTLGLFWFVINALMLEICIRSGSRRFPGAHLHGRLPRRHPAERCKRAAEVAGPPLARPSLASVIMWGRTHSSVPPRAAGRRSTTKQEGGAGLPVLRQRRNRQGFSP